LEEALGDLTADFFVFIVVVEVVVVVVAVIDVVLFEGIVLGVTVENKILLAFLVE
jgi:hypothetical protein